MKERSEKRVGGQRREVGGQRREPEMEDMDEFVVRSRMIIHDD
jgi:hypothetical protein